MSHTPATPVATVSLEAKKAAGKLKTTHPPVTLMVKNAVKELNEHGGSSLQAIKKYIAATYKVNAKKMAPYIREAIKENVSCGAFVQVKGKGASGSFKIADEEATKFTANPKVAKSEAAAKPASAKKSPAVRKVAEPKNSPPKKTAMKPKSPVKPKTTTKVPAKNKKKSKLPKAEPTKKAKSPRKKMKYVTILHFFR